MNLHFLSFILDVVSWLVVGFIYGKGLSSFDRTSNRNSNIGSIKSAMAALLGGLIATGGIALPEYGFAYIHFLIALVYALLYSLTQFAHLRKAFLNYINLIFRTSKNVYILGKTARVNKNIKI